MAADANNLCWDGCDLAALAREQGTPLYVVSRPRLRDSYRRLEALSRDAGLDVRIFFSVKTNPLPDVLRTLAAAGCGGEVTSQFELWLAQRLGIDGPRIVVNGTVKSSEYLRCAAECGPALINVECIEDIETLRDSRVGSPVNIGLRINPGLRGPRWDFATATGSARSHMGFPIGSAALEQALNLLRQTPNLRLMGLHFHIGSGISRRKPYEQALQNVLAVWRDLLRRGFAPEVLDIGGGFAASGVKTMSGWDAARAVLRGRAAREKPGRSVAYVLPAVVRSFSERLKSFAAETGTPVPRVYVEPGRSLVAAAQVLLLSVKRIVAGRRGADYAVCDGGVLSLSPLLLTEHHTIHVANKMHEPATREYTVVGNMPAPLDLVSFRRPLPALAPGDVLAVMDVGAYFTSLGSTFAGPRPAVAALDGGRATLVRRRETYADLIARDVDE